MSHIDIAEKINEVIPDEQDNRVMLLSEIKHPIKISGRSNTVFVDSGCTIDAIIDIKGDGNVVIIGRSCILTGNYLGISRCSGAKITLGNHVTMGRNTSIHIHEPANITIGNDCMLSTDIFISASDMHPLYDTESGTRVNPAKDIKIEDHVWIGFRAVILKGTRLRSGCVVSAAAVVARDVPSQSVVAGNPAQIVRTNICWQRDFAPHEIIQIKQ